MDLTSTWKADVPVLPSLQHDMLTTNDIEILRKLDLSTNESTLGKSLCAVIESIALFATVDHSEKAIRNMERVKFEASINNPVASCKMQTAENYVPEHFSKNTYIPSEYTLLTKGLPVMLQGTNYHNPWGLYDGAKGTIVEIVFAENHNPNNGNLPLYVVVHFPFYNGPAWDTNNPKV